MIRCKNFSPRLPTFFQSILERYQGEGSEELQIKQAELPDTEITNNEKTTVVWGDFSYGN
jgi:hypothetical protein